MKKSTILITSILSLTVLGACANTMENKESMQHEEMSSMTDKNEMMSEDMMKDKEMMSEDMMKDKEMMSEDMSKTK